MSEIIRVLRIYEFTGPREAVEAQVARSIHGEREFGPDNACKIRAATIGTYPEILQPTEKLRPQGPSVTFGGETIYINQCSDSELNLMRDSLTKIIKNGPGSSVSLHRQPVSIITSIEVEMVKRGLTFPPTHLPKSP